MELNVGVQPQYSHICTYSKKELLVIHDNYKDKTGFYEDSYDNYKDKTGFYEDSYM
jgi:hypothetical protein